MRPKSMICASSSFNYGRQMDQPTPFAKSEKQSLMSWAQWQRLVDSEPFHLLRQALMGFRWHLMERQLGVGSSYGTLSTSDRLEQAAQIRGSIHMIDLILTGGLDETVRKLLDLPAEIPKPLQDYMPQTHWETEEEHPS